LKKERKWNGVSTIGILTFLKELLRVNL
jgi:hypothetical protein